MFLTNEQLKNFTGWKRKSHVCKWLKENHIRHFIGADGWPRVLVSDLESRQNHGRVKPNFGALKNG